MPVAKKKVGFDVPSAVAVIYARYSSHAQREESIEQQVDVYRAIGLNNKSLSRYENGTTAPDPDTLRDLIRLDNCSLSWLVLAHFASFKLLVLPLFY